MKKTLIAAASLLALTAFGAHAQDSVKTDAVKTEKTTATTTSDAAKPATDSTISTDATKTSTDAVSGTAAAPASGDAMKETTPVTTEKKVESK